MAQFRGMVLVVGAAMFVAAPARAEEPPREHNELAVVPVLGGSTDIGFQFGAAAVLTRVNLLRPYRWQTNVYLSASVRGGPRGTEIAQQNHNLRLDVPHAVSGHVRMMPALFYDHTVNAGYFGIGNFTTVTRGPNGELGDRYQYSHEEVRARVNMRTPLGGPFQLGYSLGLRHVHPRAYAGSLLEQDVALGKVRGYAALNHFILASGLIFDSRDNEVTPRAGSFDEYVLRLGATTPTNQDIRYGSVNIVARRYLPITHELVFATRGVADFLFGNPAFYDLAYGGAFVQTLMPGGSAGIRGVPFGRYEGEIKLIANFELRLMHFKFTLFHNRFRVGNNAFFDTGRVFADYKLDDPAGHGLGLKFGTGVGVFIVWGTAAVFRLEAAYSPDAAALTPSFPFGVYANDGLMF